jgi:hypothetical protein
MSQNCGNQRACCSSPGWYVSMKRHGDDDDAAGDNSWLVHQSSLAVLPAETSGEVGGMDDRVRILPISILNSSRDL